MGWHHMQSSILILLVVSWYETGLNSGSLGYAARAGVSLDLSREVISESEVVSAVVDLHSM